MLIITGTLAYDYIMNFPGLFSDHILPENIHNINLSFIVQNFAKRRGGTAGNASYTLALLKIPHTLFSVAGKDFDEYKTTFEKLGVNMEHTKIYSEEYTATGFAVTDKQDNQIWAYSYGAADHIPELKMDDLAKPEDLVLIGPQGAKGSMNFVHQCIEKNIPYMFDPGFILTEVTNDELALGVEKAKYIIGNEYEVTLMKYRVPNFDTIVKDKVIITTLAEKGARIESNGETINILPARVEKVVDPTGAGDAWRAGFLAGIEKGFSLKTGGQMGAIAAVLAIEKVGTQEHTFTTEEFTNRYHETYNEDLTL